MYCSLPRIQFTSSTQIKSLQSFADSFCMHYKYSFSTYLLTSAVKLLNDARRCRTEDKTLDIHVLEIHSRALKHDGDIPDKLGAGQAVGGGRQYV